MKKTLITLAALAAASLSASAGVLTFTGYDAEGTALPGQIVVGATTSTAVAAGQFEFTFNIETPNFVANETLLMSVGFLETQGTYNTNTHQAFALTKNTTNEGNITYTLTAGRGTMNNEYAFTFNDYKTFSNLEADVDYTVRSFYNGNGQSYVQLGTGTGENFTLIQQSEVFDSWVYHTSTSPTMGEALTVKTYTIPEPTTATLSLLALAGLAARRRRK